MPFGHRARPQIAHAIRSPAFIFSPGKDP